MYEEKGVAKIRTIQQCIDTIKASDPDTAITEWYIRQLCKEGKIAAYSSGNKFLVNLDSLLAYLNRGLEEINKDKTNLNKDGEN